jgi:hypothetical protein
MKWDQQQQGHAFLKHMEKLYAFARKKEGHERFSIGLCSFCISNLDFLNKIPSFNEKR